jgi:hypothetical protein
MGARPVPVPRAARELSALPRIDYEDAFLVELGPRASERTAEQWARALLEGAPANLRRSLRRAWLMLGFKLASARSEAAVLGWEVRKASDDLVMLGASSRIGMPAELFVRRTGESLVAGTLLAKCSPIARLLWPGVEPGHRRVVPAVLGRLRRAD